jgi:hypothetical protein
MRCVIATAALAGALAGCGQATASATAVPLSVSVTTNAQPSSAVGGPQPSSAASTMAGAESSTPSGQPAPSTPAGLCSGDVAAARAVAVYRAMLTDPHSPAGTFSPPRKLYVSETWIDGPWFGPGVPTGKLDAAVLRCLTAGVPGLPPITTVPRPDDPSIPTVTTDGIRGFADGAVVVIFGDVRGTATKVTSFLSVDAGQGQFSGGKATLRLRGQTVVSLETHEQWVS